MRQLQSLLDTQWTPLPALAKKVLLGLAAAIVMLAVVLATQGSSTGGTVFATGSTGYGSSAPVPSSAGSPTGFGSVSAKVMVQVVGRVTKPGVYELALGARVIDAVFAAGGFLPDANQASVNLARPVADGEQLVITNQSDSSALGLGSGATGVGDTANSKLVNLNQADAATLDSLPGIGPTLAQRIIDYRTANGGFRAIGDLGKVAGIGQSLLAKLKALVTI